MDKLDDFTRGYIECALWSSNDNSDETGGEPLDKNHDLSDISEETLSRMSRDCLQFQEENESLLYSLPETGREECNIEEMSGHNFWLDRNGHGTGFWDRGYGEPGEALSVASRAYGNYDIFVGDDKSLYGYPPEMPKQKQRDERSLSNGI